MATPFYFSPMLTSYYGVSQYFNVLSSVSFPPHGFRIYDPGPMRYGTGGAGNGYNTSQIAFAIPFRLGKRPIAISNTTNAGYRPGV